jgi:pyrophosphatase PpaX
VSAHEAVFVGDSPHDIEAGNAAGVATAAVRWGPFDDGVLHACHPTRWLKEPSDLLRL